jgi:hypothetical protein
MRNLKGQPMSEIEKSIRDAVDSLHVEMIERNMNVEEMKARLARFEIYVIAGLTANAIANRMM